MLDRARREQEDIIAYDLQKQVASAILTLNIDKPTVEYSVRKKWYLAQQPSTKVLTKSIQDLFLHNGWDTNDQQFDLLIWTNYRSEYLPYLFGSFDGRVHAIANIKMKYDTATFNKGNKIILDKLTKMYKVIKFRNPMLIQPKPQKEIDWREHCPTENTGITTYYYKWNNITHSTVGKGMIHSSISPSFNFVNQLQAGQPAVFYTLADEYSFIFFPMSKAHNKAVSCDLPTDLTPMLEGRALLSGEIWPIGLKRLCFPMLAVEILDNALFNYMARVMPRNTNRNLNYYVLKEDQYYKFIEHNGGVKSSGNATVSWYDTVVGMPIDPIPQTPDLLIAEIEAKRLAILDWEEYE